MKDLLMSESPQSVFDAALLGAGVPPAGIAGCFASDRWIARIYMRLSENIDCPFFVFSRCRVSATVLW